MDDTRTRVSYEWGIEEVDEYGDVQNHNFADKVEELPNTPDGRMVLVATWGCESEGVEDRAWAYVMEGVLEGAFNNGYSVPKRFHAELERHLKKLF